MAAPIPKHLKAWAKTARAAAWTVEPTRNGHWKFTPPKGQPVVMSSTPSDGRALKNARADLRRLGLDV